MRRPITRNISTFNDPWKNCSQTIVSSFRMYVGFHNRKRVPLAEQELPFLITPVGFVLTLFSLSNYMFSRFYFHVMIYATISAWKRCSGSSLPPFILSGIHVILMLFAFISLRILLSIPNDVHGSCKWYRRWDSLISWNN